METLQVFANEATASKRRVGFYISYTDDLGGGPITGLSGGQPQISSDGAAWTNTGIGVLSEIGNGRYYADVTQATVLTAGTIVRSRYSTTDSKECAGSTLQVVSATPSVLVSDKTGFSLSSGGVQAIWDALTSASTAVGSMGKWILDKLDVVVSTRLATSGYTVPPTVGAIADQVWEETLADHSGTSGSTASGLNSASSAGDPWNTALPGGYAVGTAGKIVGSNLALQATLQSLITTVGVNGAGLTAADDAILAALAALNNLSPAQVLAQVAAALATFAAQQPAETYAADGVVPTRDQIHFMILSLLGNFEFSGTTQSMKKLDKTTEWGQYEIDSTTQPTSHTRTA